MNKNNTLLFDPPQILPPNVVLAPKCEKCEEALGSPYYIMIGIPPSPLIVASFACESIEEEKEDIGGSIMSAIKYEIRIDGIESKNHGSFPKYNEFKNTRV